MRVFTTLCSSSVKNLVQGRRRPQESHRDPGVLVHEHILLLVVGSIGRARETKRFVLKERELLFAPDDVT